jgi:hypothetical protein
MVPLFKSAPDRPGRAAQSRAVRCEQSRANIGLRERAAAFRPAQVRGGLPWPDAVTAFSRVAPSQVIVSRLRKVEDVAAEFRGRASRAGDRKAASTRNSAVAMSLPCRRQILKFCNACGIAAAPEWHRSVPLLQGAKTPVFCGDLPCQSGAAPVSPPPDRWSSG